MTMASLVQGWTRTTERIDERARKISPRQVAIFAITIIPFAIAFVIYFAWKIVWTVFTWLASACVEGWNTGKDLQAKRAAAKRGEPWTS